MQFAEWHGAQQLVGDAGDPEIGLRLETFELAAEQCGGRPAVLGVGIPGSAGEFGCPEGVVAAFEDGVRHDGQAICPGSCGRLPPF